MARMRKGLSSSGSQSTQAKHCDFNGPRRRPSLTVKNKDHDIMKVWGNNPRKGIPLLVCHYNQWMGGIDVIDQHIPYYMPDFRCHKNLLP
eukprot:319617-Ditylum_brightwellii.AAC.1